MTSIQSRGGRSFVEQYIGGSGAVQKGRGGEKFEELQRSVEERRSRGRGRGRKEQVDPTAPPVTSPPSTTPPPQSVSSPAPKDSSVRSLAEKYVDVYAQQSGKSLSSATRDALVTDVASFYGESGTRTERLRTLVGVF